MRFVAVPLPPLPPSRWTTIYNGRIAAVNALASQEQRSVYIRKHGSWTQLKSWLAGFNGQKCWYCEAKSTRAPLDVDHFRPKLGVTVDSAELVGHTGYYWLAYEWSNFRVSCQRCNRPETDQHGFLYGKANEFPIRDEVDRCKVPTALLTIEEPRLLDPCVKNDCALLSHGIDGEVRPAAAKDTWEFQRADYTIKRLGFNEWNTPESKKRHWRLLDDLIRLVGNQPAVITHLQDHLSEGHEYSCFFRSAVGTHRDKAWVEAIL